MARPLSASTRAFHASGCAGHPIAPSVHVQPLPPWHLSLPSKNASNHNDCWAELARSFCTRAMTGGGQPAGQVFSELRFSALSHAANQIYALLARGHCSQKGCAGEATERAAYQSQVVDHIVLCKQLRHRAVNSSLLTLKTRSWRVAAARMAMEALAPALQARHWVQQWATLDGKEKAIMGGALPAQLQRS